MMNVFQLGRRKRASGQAGSSPPRSRYPFSPFPTGWFLFCVSDELPPGGIVSRSFCGQELVAFRGAGGQASVLDAYCPHLGAHLGHGGEVRGDVLRCPFHGFCFGADGRCVSTPYDRGGVPPTAKARVWPVREVNGLVLVYHDAEGGAPGWDIPALDPMGYEPLDWHRWRVRSHPQETTENSVDIGHLGVVHGYERTEQLSELVTDGPYLNVRYTMSRRSPFRRGSLRADFEVHVHGLGYSQVDAVVSEVDLKIRYFVLPSPLDGEHISLTIGQSLLLPDDLGRISRALGVLPRAAAVSLLRRMMMREFRGDVGQDFRIWENKIYVHPPALAAGDGPVGRYRGWCRQFYPRTERQAG